MTVQFSPTLEERYFAKVERRGDDECWPWLAARAKRFEHGIIYVGKDGDRNVIWYAHRVGWLLIYGVDPGSHVVRHTCDVAYCQNPGHWLLGTQADNIADMMERHRDRHPGRPGERHHGAKLTASQVKEIRDRYALGGIQQKDLALEFGIQRPQMSRILSGQRWKVKGN